MKIKKDLTNKQFGYWTVLRFDETSDDRKHRRWICRCRCGIERSVIEQSLVSNASTSCGCKRTKTPMKQAKLDLIGEVYGELVVLFEAPDRISANGKRNTYWWCRCSCGKIKQISTKSLRGGTTISCGHVGKQHRKEANEKRFLENLSYEPMKNGIIPLQKLESKVQPNGQKKTVMLFKCYCGKLFTATLDAVKSGKTSSCGCYKSELAANRAIDLTGQKFNKLTVIKRGETKYYENSNAYVLSWICKCECGTITQVDGQKLRDGITKSCGCLISSGNEMVGKYLANHNVEYKKEYSFKDLRTEKNYPLRFDFAIFKDKELLGLIEYQGMQHYIDVNGYFGNQQRLITDPMKKEYCKRHNIKLFEIRYDEDVNQRCDEILNELHVNTVPSAA